MVELEIEMNDDLIRKVNNLALHYFGDASDVSKARVVEAAFQMRRLWLLLVERGEREIEEPITKWEFRNGESAGQFPAEIQRWLFRRR